MWSCCSFVSYLLVFMNKYFEGSIFTNNYIEGLAGFLACQVGGVLYAKFGMKKSFQISFGLSFIGGILIYLLESQKVGIPSSFLVMFPGTLRNKQELALNYLVPKLAFIAKFGIHVAFLCTYQASFSDDTIFPAHKRATSIGICQIFARGLTILAPEVTELPKPLPIMFQSGMVLLAWLVSCTFSS